jgi:hypothetical protein
MRDAPQPLYLAVGHCGTWFIARSPDRLLSREALWRTATGGGAVPTEVASGHRRLMHTPRLYVGPGR